MNWGLALLFAVVVFFVLDATGTSVHAIAGSQVEQAVGVVEPFWLQVGGSILGGVTASILVKGR